MVRAIEAVSDGTSIDWDALESDASAADDRECLRWLRVLDQIADLHESTADPLESRDAGQRGAPPAPEAALGTWGRYELVEQVGEGSFGSVYRARDPALDFDLAVKILHQKASDERLKRRLIDEGRALARIRHPNVVRVLGIESDGDRVGLCMDFVRGQTLEDMLRSTGPLGGAEAVLVGLDVCGALAAVHRAGFIHRDVKARNVVREQGGRNVLMDFGAGRMLSPDAAGRGDLTGTPLYMAPEVLAGASASAASDVYSVGVLLYRLVTGDYPIQGATVDEVRAAHRDGQRRFLSERRPDLPIPFVTVVERMLSTSVEERYPTAAAASDALGLVLRKEADKKESIADALSKVLKVTYGVVGLAGVALALGVVTSRTFNRSLERSEYATEMPLDLITWGARSMVLPVLIVLVALVLLSHVVVLARLLARRVRWLATVQATIERRASAWAWRHAIYDANTAAALVLAASCASLAAAVWYFFPLLLACFDPIATAPRERLALLSPEMEGYKDRFRGALTLVILIAALGWWVVRTLATRQGMPVPRALAAGGAATIVIAALVLSVPYRLTRHASFEAVTWNGEACYLLASRSSDLLVFCPGLTPPRTRAADAGAVARLGTFENIFTRFAHGSATSGP
jgi:hypothetical protein